MLATSGFIYRLALPSSENTLLTEEVIFSRPKQGKKYECAIHVELDQKRTGDEYFKLIDSRRRQNARDTKIARIFFRWPAYSDTHTNTGGAAHWYLSTSEAKQLVDILKSPYTGRATVCQGAENVWQAMILYTNHRYCNLTPEQTRTNELDISEHARTQNLPYPNALPINLPIPDYVGSLHRKTNNDKVETTTYDTRPTER